ncbi:MAG: choice-of-anchor M domain-containing protein [Propionibacteriaceae bacterium]|nr:choice-of-anchor M domain-containing protein [Propionibacteriaceae bacterium]
MKLTLPRERAIQALSAGIAALALTLLVPLASASAEGQDDPGLDQSLDTNQQIVHGEQVLQTGHVDMGPKYADGSWSFLIHDDAARADAAATSVWRYPAETVLRILDQARLSVPDDPNYAFIGADPGTTVWVVPQTQNPEAVWVGWNTQDPEVMRAIDRGVTLTLTGVRGPGVMTTYLQSGSFGEPQLLWDSRVAQAQPIWVDVNTHTHANWVFTAPGIYLVQLEASADLIDGSQVSDSQVIRFAVGTATDPAQALAASWDDNAADTADTDITATDPDDSAAVKPEGGDSWLVPVLIGAIVLVAAGLAAGAVVVIVRGNSARRRALAARVAATSEPAASDDSPVSPVSASSTTSPASPVSPASTVYPTSAHPDDFPAPERSTTSSTLAQNSAEDEHQG